MAYWLEHGQVGARQAPFAARSALAGLNATERGRLARWLAWLTVAAQSRGETSPLGQVRRLDAALHQTVEDALARLPADVLGAPFQIHRRSA